MPKGIFKWWVEGFHSKRGKLLVELWVDWRSLRRSIRMKPILSLDAGQFSRTAPLSTGFIVCFTLRGVWYLEPQRCYFSFPLGFQVLIWWLSSVSALICSIRLPFLSAGAADAVIGVAFDGCTWCHVEHMDGLLEVRADSSRVYCSVLGVFAGCVTC